MWPLASRWLGALEQAYSSEPERVEEADSVGYISTLNVVC